MQLKNILILLCITFITASCNDWLDVKPTTELDRSDLFSSESGYADALAGVYANMTSTALYGRNESWYMLDMMAGYYNYSGASGTNLTLTEYLYKHDNEDRNSSIIASVDSIWSKSYTQISNLNSILETIDENKSVFTGNNYEVVKGEALGLRAFLYFDILRMFGKSYSEGKDSLSIPYPTTLSTKVSPLITVDSALTHIISDLQQAKQLMANDPIKLGTTPSTILASLPSGAYSSYVDDWHNRRFHFNYYAATALLARAYLWKNDKANALAQAQEIINVQESKFPWVKTSNLTTIETSSKNQDRSFATEHIFALNIKRTTFINNMDGYLLQENTTSSGFLLNLKTSIFEGYTTDTRFQYNVIQNSSYNFISKFYQESWVYSFFQERMPLMKVSEMYYIAAECSTDKTTAVDYLNKVRNNRGLTTNPISTSITDTQLESEIEKEYKKEFMGEGQMWFYFKRKMATTISGMDKFTSTDLYTFDRPEEEDLYGGR